jgi:hypothetical protein
MTRPTSSGDSICLTVYLPEMYLFIMGTMTKPEDQFLVSLDTFCVLCLKVIYIYKKLYLCRLKISFRTQLGQNVQNQVPCQPKSALGRYFHIDRQTPIAEAKWRRTQPRWNFVWKVKSTQSRSSRGGIQSGRLGELLDIWR